MRESDSRNGMIAVFGASGHTGQLVVAELERHLFQPIRIGRDAAKLAATDNLSGHPACIVCLDKGASIDAALVGARAIINCAGPFLDTALPVVDAAIRAGIPYLDVCAEQATVQSIFETRHAAAVHAGIAVCPAAAFFGGLADLLATVAVEDAAQIDEISIAVGLDSWHPTKGTRITGQRNTAPRLVRRRGRLVALLPQNGLWQFPDPLGSRDVTALPFSEMITLASHLDADTINSWINVEAIRDIRDVATPEPIPVDDLGRSAQRFVLDVVASTAGNRRRVTASGRDIYHISAAIVVEAAERLLASEADGISGVMAIGKIFDARDFLRALEPYDVQTDYSVNPPAILKKGNI